MSTECLVSNISIKFLILILTVRNFVDNVGSQSCQQARQQSNYCSEMFSDGL